jgi:hypothetical protein
MLAARRMLRSPPFAALSLTVLGMLATPSRVAHAQSPSSSSSSGASSASALFQQGMSLFRRGETTTACRMFEESYAMDAAPGTLFNLAVCHEAEGRLADAYRELDLLAVRAESTGRADKAQSVRARADALQPKLARVDLNHRAPPRRSEVVGVSIDDTPLLAGEWSRPQYLAPQAHQVHVHFADGSEVTRKLDALRAGSSTAVVLEEPAPEVAPAPATASSGTGSHQEMSPARRTAVFATAGAGVALLAAGTVFGVLTLVKRKDGIDTCDSNGVCATGAEERSAVSDRSDARTFATLSTIGFAAGGAALVGSAVLYLTAGRSADHPSTGWRLLPAADPHGAGLALGSAF